MLERQLRQVMKELVAAQSVVEESADQFAFRHTLTREAAYSTVLWPERKQYRRLIGETIERASADSRETNVAELACHFSQTGERAKTVEYARCEGASGAPSPMENPSLAWALVSTT